MEAADAQPETLQPKQEEIKQEEVIEQPKKVEVKVVIPEVKKEEEKIE